MTATARFFGLDPDLLRDPWPVFTAWRDEGPVARLDALDGWVVTDAEVARAVLLDADTWSSEAVEGPRPPGHGEWLQELAAADPAVRELLAVPLQTLLGLDAPAHTRLRRVLAPWFSAAAIARLEPLVTGLVDELLPGLCTGEPVDVVAGYARVLPLRTVATLLGLPREEWDAFARLAAGASTTNPHLETREGLRRRLTAELELLRFFDARLNDAARTDDADGLVSGLAAAVTAGRLSRREAAGLCREVLVAGAESTGAHLASAVLLLARDPASACRAAASRPALEALVEEALRLEPAFTGFWRRARRDTVVAGVALPAGSLLLVAYAALNRDPRAHPEPHRVELDRPAPRRHLAFGHGVHFCLGAPLVRLQSVATLSRLLARVERIELLVADAELEYEPSVQDRALRALPVRLVPRAAP